jgi:hypothetical protein
MKWSMVTKTGQFTSGYVSPSSKDSCHSEWDTEECAEDRHLPELREETEASFALPCL